MAKADEGLVRSGKEWRCVLPPFSRLIACGALSNPRPMQTTGWRHAFVRPTLVLRTHYDAAAAMPRCRPTF
jgi:hypothetical protein